MKLVYQINPQTSLEIECPNVKAVIKELTVLRDSVGQEVCGQCGSEWTVLRHRNVDDNDYYEHVCLEHNCRAVLALGANKEGETLYKKRLRTNNKGKAVKDGDKPEYLPKNGWGRYNPQTKEVEY